LAPATIYPDPENIVYMLVGKKPDCEEDFERKACYGDEEGKLAPIIAKIIGAFLFFKLGFYTNIPRTKRLGQCCKCY
jgi:hypothetical protein